VSYIAVMIYPNIRVWFSKKEGYWHWNYFQKIFSL